MANKKKNVAALKESVQKYLSEEAYNTQLIGITSGEFVDCLQIKFQEAVKSGFDHISTQAGPVDQDVEQGMHDKMSEAFDVLSHFTHEKYFHVPDFVVLPEDEVQRESSSHDQTTSMADVRKLYNQVLDEKQTSTHMDERLKELQELHSHLTQVRDNMRQVNDMITPHT